uniref:RING-type domain-containing protein n=1 Tax=Nelumbo nucifera TaxID=4432 RepID=A0A822Z5P8_NELNU|nr:TPA_asm: hypothetical protein HUJ06_016038 [Nelumbo nucifera]
MLISIIFALLLPCLGMSLVFLVYFGLLWCATRNSATSASIPSPEKPLPQKGLSASELEKLPKTTGAELMGTECAVCLDEIESSQPARLLPGCNHGFHLECADSWLSRNPICPLCRAKLETEILNPDNNIC